MKAKKGLFLVAYDYGMGGLWGVLSPARLPLRSSPWTWCVTVAA